MLENICTEYKNIYVWTSWLHAHCPAILEVIFVGQNKISTMYIKDRKIEPKVVIIVFIFVTWIFAAAAPVSNLYDLKTNIYQLENMFRGWLNLWANGPVIRKYYNECLALN